MAEQSTEPQPTPLETMLPRKEGHTQHWNPELDFFELEIKKAMAQGKTQQILVNKASPRPLSNRAALAHVAGLRKTGLVFYPHPRCTDYDEYGRCKGHPAGTPGAP